MPDVLTCPGCQRRLRLPAGFAGGAVRCPSCRTEFSAAPVPSDVAFSPTPVAPAPVPTAPPAPDPAPRRPAVPAPGAKAPRRKSRGGLYLLLGINGAIVLGLVGVLVWAWAVSRPKPAAFQEDDEERRRAIREAFADQKPLAPEEIARELRPLFDDLGNALRAGDGERITALFDTDRMVDECAALAPGALRTPGERAAFARGVRMGMGAAMQKQAAILKWTSTEIRSIKVLNNLEAVVIARHPDEGLVLKMRWWVTRRDGPWKVYDYEDLDGAVRASVLMASVLGQGFGRAMELGRAGRAFQDALQDLVVRQNPDGAERKLQSIADVALPRQLEAMRFMLTASIRLQRNKPQDALDAVQRARGFHADMPVLDLLEGTALNQLGQYAKALPRLEAYRDLLGEDAPICHQLGEALLGLERFPEAARAYRKSLDFHPKDADVFFGLLRSLGWQDNLDDVGPRFAKLDNPHENFVVFAKDCEERHFPALLERLAEAMRRIDPEFAAVDYHLALVRARAQKTGEAVKLFRAALDHERDAAKKKEYAEGFLRAMAQVGKAAEAYAVAPDPRAAFRLLAGEAMRRYATDDLKRLLAAHKQKQPDDPLAPFYQAELYVRQGRYAAGDKAFTAAMAKPPDDDTLKEFRASRVLARYHTGRALPAYREIGPRQETFAQLASLAFGDENDAVLIALLDARVADDPDDLDVRRFRWRLKIRKGQADEGAALFKAALARDVVGDRRAALVSEFLSDMVRAGKAVEAYKAAPDPREAFEILADQLLEDDRLDELRPLLDAHRAKHADDPSLALYQADVYFADKAWDKAVTVLRDGMKRAAEEARNGFRWKLVHALYKAGRAMQAYEEVGPRQETFAQLANLLAADKKGAELLELVKVHRPHATNLADLYFHEARALILLKRPDEALGCFRKACEAQADQGLRGSYVHQFVAAMDEAGRGLEAYRAAADKATAFEALAGRLLSPKREKELRALLDEHGKGHAKEAPVRYYTGEWHLLRGDAARAEPCFADALAANDPRLAWRERHALFRTRVKLGKAAVTYRQFDPGTQTFTELAELCEQEKDVGQLQALLDAHRETDPDDPALAAWAVEIKWLKEDYAGVLELLTERRDDIFAMPQYRWKYDDRLVRCLVKLKRPADAVREAEARAKKVYGNRVLLVLAHAAAGDVKGAIAVLDKERAPPYLVAACYGDADLGPILRGEPFAAFREKYPEPKDEPGEDAP